MIVFIIISIIVLFIIIITYILNKNNIFCDNLNSLIYSISDNKIKFKYQKLKYSNTYFKLKKLFKDKGFYIAVEKNFNRSKNFILTVSKYIDYKINFNKSTYRSKSKETVIENLSRLLVLNIHKDHPYVLFKEYKNNYNSLQIKLKENKIFKILLAKFLLNEFISIYKEIIYISKIIHKYKKRNFNYNYSKNIYNCAKYYAIFKYNNNALNYELKHDLNKTEIIDAFFSYLFEAECKLKIIVTYLKTMFWFSFSLYFYTYYMLLYLR